MNEEIKILCVDDEQNVLNSLKRLFIDDDYTIITASSGPEGLAILEKDHVHVVLSDYRMPGMNGVDFLKEVRRLSPQTIRIVLSGYADTASIVSAINEGQIYKFVPKPWNDDELKMTIEHAIERFFLHRENAELTRELEKKNEELLQLNARLMRLLEEKTEGIEFRNLALDIKQNILDSLPVGIIGVDYDDMIVQCNDEGIEALGADWSILGKKASQVLPPEISSFLKTAWEGSASEHEISLHGTGLTLRTTPIRNKNNQRGVLLVLIRGNPIPNPGERHG